MTANKDLLLAVDNGTQGLKALIFDLEGAFIFSWAIAARSLGWTGWLQIAFFILVLIGGLVYVWAKGGLEWGPGTSRK